MIPSIKRALGAVALVGAAASGLIGTGTVAANAATTPGYPTAIVQYGASARTIPYILASDYSGFTLHDRGGTGNQTASVMCWYDGDWATGNYRTNRWFRVLVYENYDGYQVPRWLFVHGSYVYNQPVVRQCVATTTGYW